MNNFVELMIKCGLFLLFNNKGKKFSGFKLCYKSQIPVFGVRQARNLGHEDQVDLTLQSADYKVGQFTKNI